MAARLGREWSDLIFAHTNDLGSAETLSEAQISICRRAATLECELEAMEGRMSAGRPIEIEVYGRLCGRLCRLFEMIGVRRVTRAPDPLNDLAWAFAVGARALDDDEPGDEDQPLPIEEGFDREPGEA